VLDDPHPAVQQRIAERAIALHLVTEPDIAGAMRLLYDLQGLLVEPSSAVTVAVVQKHERELEEPVCIILTGENITREDFFRLIATETV
jgi:threonine synthase